MGCEVCAFRTGPAADHEKWSCVRGFPAMFFNRECDSFKFDEKMTIGWMEKG
jgi:hypothetical protein